MRELFVYYRVPVERVAQVEEQVHRLQRQLRAARPELRTRLLRRPQDGGSEHATFMETYAMASSAAGGVDADLQGAIESAAAQQLTGLAGPRHVEVFLACPAQ